MLTAKEAAIRTKLNDQFNKEIERIEGFIVQAIRKGEYGVRISNNGYDKELWMLIKAELEKYGYSFLYDPPKELPSGCPSDQWDFSGYLNVCWEGKEK